MWRVFLLSRELYESKQRRLMSPFRRYFARFSYLALILSLSEHGEASKESGKKDSEIGKPADISLDGDTLPQGAAAQFRNGDLNYKGATYGLAFSPDGRWLMVTGDSTEICLLDRFTSKVLKSFSVGARGSVGRAVLSQDGRLLAAVVDSGPTPARVHVWEIESGRERWSRGTDDLNLVDLSFSPDGRTLALAGRQTMHLWDAATGNENGLLGGHAENTPLGGEDDVLVLAFSPDGKLLASGNRGGRVHVWDVGSRKPVRLLGPPPGSGTRFATCCLRFSPDGALLACGQNSRVLVWDTLLWKEVCELGDHDGGVFSLGFSPDSRTLATGCWDTQIRLWEVVTWKKWKDFKGHSGRVYHTTFSPDGRALVSGGQDGKVYLWDVFVPATQGTPPPYVLSREKLDELWGALQGSDATRVYQAVCVLAAAPKQGVPFMKERLQPATVGTAQVERLLADLGADSYAVRTKATATLAQLGRWAQPALHRTLSNPPSVEVRRRVGDLLARLEREPPPPEFLLVHRATAILEIMGSAEAREILKVMAKGAPGAPVTEHAKASLGRLARRPASAR